MHRTYVFGDSIAFGQHVSTEKTWPLVTTRRLRSSQVDLSIQVAARNGETSLQALDRLHFDVLSHQPDLLWVQFGLNDANFWAQDQGLPRVSSDLFASCMNEIVHRALHSGIGHTFVATNHQVTKDVWSPLLLRTYRANASLYNERLRIESKGWPESRVTLVDLDMDLQKLDCEPETLLLDDGVHLNEIGHLHYARLVTRVLTEYAASRAAGTSGG